MLRLKGRVGDSAKKRREDEKSTFFTRIFVIRYSVAVRRIKNGAQRHGEKDCDYEWEGRRR